MPCQKLHYNYGSLSCTEVSQSIFHFLTFPGFRGIRPNHTLVATPANQRHNFFPFSWRIIRKQMVNRNPLYWAFGFLYVTSVPSRLRLIVPTTMRSGIHKCCTSCTSGDELKEDWGPTPLPIPPLPPPLLHLAPRALVARQLLEVQPPPTAQKE